MLQTLLLIFSLSGTSTAFKITIQNDLIASLVDTTSSILLQAFRDPFGSVHISTSSQDQADLLDAVIAQLDGQIALRLDSSTGEVPRRPWFWNMFIVDGYEAFKEQYGKLTVNKYDFSGRYLVVFSSCIDEVVIRKIFNDLWKLQIVNVVLVGLMKQEVQLWSYHAFSSRACRMVHLDRIRKVDAGELYPDKTISFHNCLLKVASFETRPYTVLQRLPKGILKMSGFEGAVLDILMEKLNFRTIIYEPPNGEQWGYPSEHNSTGIMRMIKDEEVDFGMSCLGISEARMKILKAGIAHHTSMIALAVPKGRLYTPLEKLARPFSTTVWLLIGAILLIAFFSIGIVNRRTKVVQDFVYGRGIRTPRLNLIQVFFGLGLLRIPARNFARTMLMMWILFCFVLRTLYQGSMFQSLQENTNHPPSKTLNEIDETDAFYYVAESGERYYEAFPERLQRVRHLPQEQDNIIHRLEWMEHHPESSDVVMGTLDTMAHHNLLYRRKGLEPVPICRETITTFSIAIYYPKKSMLTIQFDRQMERIVAAGLMNYWVKQYGDYEFFGRSKKSTEPRQLNNEHLMVAYELYGVLVLISWVVFGLEMISVRVQILWKFFCF